LLSYLCLIFTSKIKNNLLDNNANYLKVESVYPEYKQARQWLRNYGHYLNI